MPIHHRPLPRRRIPDSRPSSLYIFPSPRFARPSRCLHHLVIHSPEQFFGAQLYFAHRVLDLPFLIIDIKFLVASLVM